MNTYTILIYITMMNSAAIHLGHPNEERIRRWKMNFRQRGGEYFEELFSRETVYRGYFIRVCNMNVASSEDRFAKILRDRYRLGEDSKAPKVGALFRFRNRYYLYYHGYGVFTNENTKCGDTNSLDTWNQEALYCYTLMQIIL